MKMNVWKIVFALTFLTQVLFANGVRVRYSVNENWQFLRKDIPDPSQFPFGDAVSLVSFPHTWNACDAVDDAPGYYRDIAWYGRSINIPSEYEGKQLTLFFEGANQEVELFVNGRSAGTHVGGYTRFSFNITNHVRFGSQNQFAIKVNNRANEDIPPLSADFTFFGGIYRDVYMIVTSGQHISTTHYASSGVYHQTPEVSGERAKLLIKTMLTNAAAETKNLRIEHTVVGPDKKTVITTSEIIKLPKNCENVPTEQTLMIRQPKLWSPESPTLYGVLTRVYDVRSKALLDEVYQPLGFRWFEFTAEKGFVLNGKPYKLIGTNRHQCYDKMGNALPDEMHVRDIKLLKDMGANFLRVSHYPQDPTLMELCDKLGIIASVELPIVNAITENEAFASNSLEMAREMIFQDYNRPSVLIWSYMNEVLLKLPFRDDAVRNESYLKSVEALAGKIEDQIRKDDPYRYTLIPFHGNFDLYHSSGLSQIPMIIGWNLYQGWYGSTFDKFGVFLDLAQEKLKGKPFVITEYGADVDPRLHSFSPVRFDYTQEYANLYHEHYIKAINERTYVAGANIWNLNDFHSEERENAVPRINSKGITTLTRELKDTYLHYQAMLSSTPVVNIGGRIWTIRGGNANENNVCMQPVKVYANLEEIEFFLNGYSLGKSKASDYIASFDVPFVNGVNVLEAIGYSGGNIVRDQLKVDFRMIGHNLKEGRIAFEEINVMLGSKRYFEDKTNAVIWLPEQSYVSGSWGYTGGTEYVKRTRHGQQPASDLNIRGTEIDPVFQTMRQGIKSFKLDVPDGEYTVSLYFAELMSDSAKVLVYNLGDDAIAENIGERIFDVSINNSEVLRHFNIAKEYGELQAVIRKFTIFVKDGQGISVDFHPVKGEPILNALRVYRNY
jgi:beta-galactosidase